MWTPMVPSTGSRALVTDRSRDRDHRGAWLVLAVAAVYLAAWTTLSVVAMRFQTGTGVSVWFPPTGLDLVLLLVFGLRYAPVLLATGVLHWAVIAPVGLSPAQVGVLAVATAAAYTGTAAVLVRGLGVDPRLVSQRDVGWFVALACGAGPLVIAAAQVAVLVAAGQLPRAQVPVSVAGAWAGMATGVGMLAPVLLVAARRWRSRWAGRPDPPPELPGAPISRWERAAQPVAVLGTVWAAYSAQAGGSLDYTYLVYLPLIWVAARGGFGPATVAVLLADVGAAVANGGRVPAQGGITLQFGLVTLTVVGLLLGALITQRWVDAEAHRLAALHDPLTGLANRALFTDRLAHALARGDRDPGHRFAVLFLDLDRFKTVNDSLGHAAGDAVLVEVAHRLRAVTRPQDSLARFGGDEFAILIEDLPGPPELRQLADRVLGALAAPHPGDGRTVVPASVGSVLVTGDDRTAEDLLRDADVALHQAKRAGRARHVMFDPGMHLRAVAGLQREAALRAAVDAGEIEVAFQPVRALPGGQLVAAEALARWAPRDGGPPVPPGEFIPIAEETGLICALGRHVLTRACAAAAGWPPAARGGLVRVAVNVSPLELHQSDYLTTVTTALADTGLPADRLVLELTESQWMSHTDSAVTQVLTDLADTGVHLAVDDFGVGYSSLAYLRRLPVTGLKIDRSFVAGLPADRDTAAIVTAVLAMAAELDLDVVAEGVETPDQLAFLTAHDCPHAQGYLLGRPSPTAPS